MLFSLGFTLLPRTHAEDSFPTGTVRPVARSGREARHVPFSAFQPKGPGLAFKAAGLHGNRPGARALQWSRQPADVALSQKDRILVKFLLRVMLQICRPSAYRGAPPQSSAAGQRHLFTLAPLHIGTPIGSFQADSFPDARPFHV